MITCVVMMTLEVQFIVISFNNILILYFFDLKLLLLRLVTCRAKSSPARIGRFASPRISKRL